VCLLFYSCVQSSGYCILGLGLTYRVLVLWLSWFGVRKVIQLSNNVSPISERFWSKQRNKTGVLANPYSLQKWPIKCRWHREKWDISTLSKQFAQLWFYLCRPRVKVCCKQRLSNICCSLTVLQILNIFYVTICMTCLTEVFPCDFCNCKCFELVSTFRDWTVFYQF